MVRAEFPSGTVQFYVSRAFCAYRGARDRDSALLLAGRILAPRVYATL